MLCHLVDKIKISYNTKLKLLLTTIFLVGVVSFLIFGYFILHVQCWLISGAYIGFYYYIKWLTTRCSNRLIRHLYTIISIPIYILLFLFDTLQPFLIIIGTYFFVILFAFGIPVTLLNGLTILGWLGLKPETIIFLTFVLGSIICSNSYYSTKWIVRHSPLRDWKTHNYESYREELAIYLIHPSDVTFLLYLLYFILISITGFLQLEKDSCFIYKGLDNAVIKAFLVFIAFTNMRTKAKDTNLNTKDLLARTLKLFERDT